MSKILISDGLDPAGLATLRQSAEVDDRPGISSADLLALIQEFDALIVRGRTKVTQPLLEAGTNLKVVGRAGVGVDNIDLPAAAGRGVTVVNAPTSTSIAVAELTFGLLLAIAREIPRADGAMKQGQWLKKELEGVELSGKTLGVIGFGRIGAEVGKRATGFGMTVLAYDPLLADDEIRCRGGQPVALEPLYEISDFISLHVPLDESTLGLLGQAAFASMKPGVRLVCAARGGVIDESALLAALEGGRVAAAGLDVFAQEPPGSSALVAHPRVVASPHIGAQTLEAQARASLDIADEVLAALRGETLRWKVA
jgi:D-3-phosphoglycerate dehydrogenase / 2-oxoglutarate reductase